MQEKIRFQSYRNVTVRLEMIKNKAYIISSSVTLKKLFANDVEAGGAKLCVIESL